MENEFVLEKSIYAVIIPGANGLYSATSRFDDKVFTQEVVDEIIDMAMKSPVKTGSFKTVYYEITPFESTFIFVAADVGDQIALYRTSVFSTLLTFLGTYLLLFLIVLRLSFKVFQKSIIHTPTNNSSIYYSFL
jgi:hypothetical protein